MPCKVRIEITPTSRGRVYIDDQLVPNVRTVKVGASVHPKDGGPSWVMLELVGVDVEVTGDVQDVTSIDEAMARRFRTSEVG